MEGRFLPSHGDGEMGSLSFSVIICQRNGFQVLEEDIPGGIDLGKTLNKRSIKHLL